MTSKDVAELLRATREAADFLAELYAKYSTKVGPFASQAQRINGVLQRAMDAVQQGETTPGIRLMDDGRAMGGSDVCWTCQAHCVEIEDLRRALTRIGELSASFKPVVDRVLAGYPIEGPGPAVETTGAQQMKVTDEMVTRFLGWKLPQDFNPDGGVTFTPINHPACWPIGTNLLTAVQARAMLEHVLAVETSALSSCNCPAAPGEDCPLTEHECDKRRRAVKASERPPEWGGCDK